MKCRIYLTETGGETYYPVFKTKKPEESDDDFFERSCANFLKEKPSLKDCEYHDCDSDDIPMSDKFEHPLYVKNNELKRDSAFENCLMTKKLLRIKFIKKINDSIEEELGKKSPDAITIIRLQIEKERVKKYTEQECYEKSLESLDERVSQGKTDKTEIRNKIKAKIKELKSSNK